MTYMVNNRIHVTPGYEEEFEARFRARAGEIDKQPGFVAMRVLRPQGNQAPYVVETEWENQEAFGDGGGIEQFEVVIRADTAKASPAS